MTTQPLASHSPADADDGLRLSSRPDPWSLHFFARIEDALRRGRLAGSTTTAPSCLTSNSCSRPGSSSRAATTRKRSLPLLRIRLDRSDSGCSTSAGSPSTVAEETRMRPEISSGRARFPLSASVTFTFVTTRNRRSGSSVASIR